MAELKSKLQTLKIKRKTKYQLLAHDQTHHFKPESPNLHLSGSKIIFYPISRPKSSCKGNISVLSSYAFSSPVEYQHYSHIRPDLIPKLFKMNKQILSNFHSLTISKNFPQNRSFSPSKIAQTRCSSPGKSEKNNRVRSKSRQRVYADQVDQLMFNK